MTFIITASLAASLALAPMPARGDVCLDPAAPLKTLIASYDRWPARLPGKRSDDAWQKAQAYFKGDSNHDYYKAVLAYQNLEADHPRDRHIKLALALLYAAGPELNFPEADGYRHVTVLNYSNADTRGARNLQAVMQQDSTQWIAAIALTRVALVSTETERIKEAQRLIQRALTADPSNTALHLAWGDLLVREGRHAEALAYSDAHGGSCTARQHVRAEALMLAGDTAAGTRLYLETLSRAQPHELDRFYDDARVMMTVGQIKAYRALPAEKKAQWLVALWHRTAAASGRTVETRIAEQMIRAAYADAHYRALYVQGPYSRDRLAVISDTSHIVPWSNPGVYYVRHGPPDIQYDAVQGNSEFMAWVWRQMDPTVILLFSRSKLPPTDWITNQAPSCANTDFLGKMNVDDTRARIASGVGLTVRDIYFALADYDPRFLDIIHECTFVVMGMKRIRYDQLMVQYRYDNAKLFRRLAQSESALPHFRPGVRIAVAAYQFNSATDQPEIVVLPAVPIIDLRGTTAPATRLRILYAVTDTLVASFTTDTTVALPSNAPSTGLVRVPIVLRNPAITNGSLRVTITDPADTLTGATRRVPFNVRTETGGVTLSDIVIADADANGPLVRGAFRLSPLPDHRVQIGDTFRVFYELYGVRAGEKIETSIHLKRTDQKTIKEQLGLAKRDEKTIAFSGEAELDARGVAVRDVQMTGDLVKGTYSVTITVTTAGGATARRTGTLIVE